MLFRFQDRLLRTLYPVRPAAGWLLWLGILSFPALFAVAVFRPQTDTGLLFIGLVCGLSVVLFGILVSMSRPEAAPKQGLSNRLRRFWEGLVFWGWLACLVLVASLAMKIVSFSS
ncbi:hypothetical protein BGP77_13780 [Saccharospirillum sp. MSK14-1]|uniref:hypothetical protein n=1 Tax=Saccharospirillum sp. MSK14-1 TaxID=1897632 RepID=UPI000D36BE32|nr:hypothetical protein [Saccharospirillum sp. MSK14-1]PTY37562.1 hypothetical protein BGP77_13780 [Saccharospirillum sp. MSK14-1]